MIIVDTFIFYKIKYSVAKNINNNINNYNSNGLLGIKDFQRLAYVTKIKSHR